jgi:hypothetical protein
MLFCTGSLYSAKIQLIRAAAYARQSGDLTIGDLRAAVDEIIHKRGGPSACVMDLHQAKIISTLSFVW